MQRHTPPLRAGDKDLICRFTMTINLSRKRSAGAPDNAAINMQMRQRQRETNLFWISVRNQRRRYLRRTRTSVMVAGVVFPCRVAFVLRIRPFLVSLLFYINTRRGKSLPLPRTCGRSLINLTRMRCFSGEYLTVAGLQNAPHLKAILWKSPYSK